MRYPEELGLVLIILQQLFDDVIAALISQPPVVRYMVYATIAARLMIALLRLEQRITRLVCRLRRRYRLQALGRAQRHRSASRPHR